MSYAFAVVGSGPSAAINAASQVIVSDMNPDPDAGGSESNSKSKSTFIRTDSPIDADVTVVITTTNQATDDITAVTSEALTAGSPVVLVEFGGMGGCSIDEVDAAITAFPVCGPTFETLQTRVIAARSSSNTEFTDRVTITAGSLAGQRAVAMCNRSDGDSDNDVSGTVLEISGTTVGPERDLIDIPEVSTHSGDVVEQFIPQQTTRNVDLEVSLSRAERAVDDRLGIITQVGERESFPAPYYIAQTASTKSISDVRAVEFAAGVDIDWNAAYMKALGEALERYCAGVYRTEMFITASEHAQNGPVSPQQFVQPKETPTYDPSTPISWVPGVDLSNDERVTLPATFVYHPPPDERYRPAITTGLGLGNGGVEALRAGLSEVIERDAAMLAWYSTFEPIELTVDDEQYQTLCQRAQGVGLNVQTILLTQDIDIPVIATAVYRNDGEWPRFAIGSAAGLDPFTTAQGSLTEALQNWMELRAMGEDDASDAAGAIGEYATFPDRAREFIMSENTISAEDIAPSPIPTGEHAVQSLIDRVIEVDLDVYATRITTRDVSKLGFEVVRVLIPRAQPLFQQNSFFGERARNIPREFGFNSRLDRSFHPFP